MTSVMSLCYHLAMKVTLSVRMEDDLKKDLEQMAQEEGRSLNNLIVHLLKCAVVSNGILKSARTNRGRFDVSTMLLRKENDK